MADQILPMRREITQRRFIIRLTKNVWNGCEELAIDSLKYIWELFDTLFIRKQVWFAMRLVGIGDLIPCICMHWSTRLSVRYCYWAINVLNRVIAEYPLAKEKLIHNGGFTKAVLRYGTFGAHESEKVARKLMTLFNSVLISDQPNLLDPHEVCKCIDAVFIMLSEWPNSRHLHMRAYDNLIWTSHRYAYDENGVQLNRRICLVIRKLNHYFKAEAARLLKGAEGLIPSKDKWKLETKLHCATSKPRFQINFSDLRTASLDLLWAQRKDSFAILTMAIWQSKIDEIHAAEQNANRRITRSHERATQHLAWGHCQSDVILGNVVTFLPPPF
jgi:hypothetical protein